MSTRTRIIAISALAALFLVGSGVTFGMFMLEKARADVRAKQLEAEALTLRARGVSQLERELAATKEDREELRGLLLPQGEVINFLSLVETLGISSGTEVTTASINVVDTLPILDTLSIHIKATGSQEGVLHVLALLETLPYASKVTQARLQAAEGGSSTLWTGEFTLELALHKNI
jgi:hypothetical protein